jgi:hypothetical protein
LFFSYLGDDVSRHNFISELLLLPYLIKHFYLNHYLNICILLVLVSCTSKSGDPTHFEENHQPLKPIPVIVLANLPDSLQPKAYALDTMAKPLVINVPFSNNGSYSVIDAAGEKQSFSLKPPIVTQPPVLTDKNGNPILDANGNPLIMGDGGLSHFTTFTSENGLALDGVSCATVDQDGNLWIGTGGGGVSRYDGKSFTTFSTAQGLAGNEVASIMTDRHGNVWMGSLSGGVSRYDGKNFTVLSTEHGLPDNDVRSMVEDNKGNIWFGTRKGISRFDGKNFKNFTKADGLRNDRALSIIEDKKGMLWFGTVGGGVIRYDGNSFTTFSTDDGLAGNIVLSITETKNGILWFGTDGGGISRYDGRSFTTYSTRAAG